MAEIIPGTQVTTSYTVTGQRPEHWRLGVRKLNPNGKASLYALMERLRSEKAKDARYHWYEELRPTYHMELDAPLLTTDTTMVVKNTALLFPAKSLLRLEQTGELVEVSADPTTSTQLQIIRNVNDPSTPVGLADIDPDSENYKVKYIGSSLGENSLSPTGAGYQPEESYNYVGIHRTTMSISETARLTTLRTGNQVQRLKRQCYERHATGIERCYWWGKRGFRNDADGNPQRFSDGIYEQILRVAPQNIEVVNGVWTARDLEEYMERIFVYGNQTKIAYAGSRAHLALKNIAEKNGQIRFTPRTSKWGMDFIEYEVIGYKLRVITHPMFTEDRSVLTGPNIIYGNDSDIFVLDTEELEEVYLRKTKWQSNLQENDRDGMKAGYLTETSMRVNFPIAHGVIRGLVGGAANP